MCMRQMLLKRHPRLVKGQNNYKPREDDRAVTLCAVSFASMYVQTEKERE